VLALLMVVLAQEVPAGTGEVMRTLGPFSAAVLIGGFWVRDLQGRLKSSTAREQLLSDRLVELAERSLPVMSKVAEELPRVVRELERRQDRDR
jgi:hypothetical protein